MGDRARRDPELDVWRERIAEELRAHMARRRLTGADGARALGMDQATFSRKMLGKVSFSAEEILKLSNWMNRHVDEVLAAAYNGTTFPCLSQSDDPDTQNRVTDWARRGYELARRLYGDHLDVSASAA
jgi:transcriptional regulator with XRE-family HTH domain